MGRLLDFVVDLIRVTRVVLFSSDDADTPVIDEFMDRLAGRADPGALSQ
jgi:hypothetical protein